MLNKALSVAAVLAFSAFTTATAHAAETSALAKYGNDLCSAAVENGAAGDDNDDDIGQDCEALVTTLTASNITAAALTQKICLRAADWSSTYFEAKENGDSAVKLKKLKNQAIKDCFTSSQTVSSTDGITL